jgi:hypothetical protein
MLTGCRCQTEAFNCAQGDRCPLRQPVKAEPDRAAQLARNVRIGNVLVIAALASAALLVIVIVSTR